MGEVVRFRGATRLDLDADQVLGAAKEADLVDVVIIGRTKDDDDYFASSIGSPSEILWRTAFFQKRLLEGFEDE